MSLINEMLRDLETRQPEPAAGSDALSGLRSPVAVSGGKARPHRAWLVLGLVTAVVLVGGLVTMLWPTSPLPPGQVSAPAPTPPNQADPVPPVTKPASDITAVKPQAPPAAVPPPRTGHLTPAAADTGTHADTTERMNGPADPAPAIEQIAATPPKQSPDTASATSPPVPAAQARPPLSQPIEPVKPSPVTPRMSAEVRSEPVSPRRAAQRFYEQGLEALRRNERRTAEASFHEALNRSATLVPARVELSRLLIADRRAEEAAQLLDAGLILTPGHSGLTQLRARLLVEEGALDDAAALLRTSPPTLNDAPGYHALLAAVEQRRGHDEAAVEIYRQLVAQRPEAGQWHMGLAISLERLGAHVRAADAYTSALMDSRLSTALRRYAQERLTALRS